jgi:hypothetical protein
MRKERNANDIVIEARWCEPTRKAGHSRFKVKERHGESEWRKRTNGESERMEKANEWRKRMAKDEDKQLSR